MLQVARAQTLLVTLQNMLLVMKTSTYLVQLRLKDLTVYNQLFATMLAGLKMEISHAPSIKVTILANHANANAIPLLLKLVNGFVILTAIVMMVSELIAQRTTLREELQNQLKRLSAILLVISLIDAFPQVSIAALNLSIDDDFLRPLRYNNNLNIWNKSSMSNFTLIL